MDAQHWPVGGTVQRNERGALREGSFDGFLSYSHAMDGRLAPVLQAEVERFAKQWYSPRVRRVFRDDANLAANPDLWESIEHALARSRWFILLASPEAARSSWVGKEVDWWMDRHDGRHMLVVLTAGVVPWNLGAESPDAEPALPTPLLKRLRGEPRWIDLRWVRDADQVDPSNPRFRDCIADIAAAISEVEKDSLVGEHVRQRRRTLRLVRLVVGTLSVLLAAALVSGLVAFDQRNAARTQADIATPQARLATARLLVSTSEALVSSRLDLAELLGVKAYALQRDAQTRSTLFRAATANPELVRFVALGSRATALAAADKASVAVVGTADGRVTRWDTGAGRAGAGTEPGRLQGPIQDVAVSADGTTIAATDASRAVVWGPAASPVEVPLPKGSTPRYVAVSPSGGRAAVAGDHEARVVIAVLDLRTHAARHAFADIHVAPRVAFQDESALTVLSEAGYWQVRDARSLIMRHDAGVGFGVHVAASDLSRNGKYAGYTTGGGSPEIPVWKTTSAAPSQDTPDLLGREPASAPEALAISPDGRRIAVADTGSVFVSDPRPGAPPDEFMQLKGNTRI